MSNNNGFRIEWGLQELGPRPAGQPAQRPARPVDRDINATLDFSRLDYGRAVAAGYIPANAQRFDNEAA